MHTRSVPKRFQHVLCAVDFSDHSREALRYAAALARQHAGTLTVLFVNDPLLLAAAAAGYAELTLNASARRELGRFVQKTLPQAVRRAVSPTCEVRFGKPVAEIVRRATEGRFDVVVLGTRGLNAASRLLFGSTTTGVLHHARIPVLAIPPAVIGRPTSRLARIAALA
jgi:nucleotide-binding universal stress UspA family protein